MYHTTNGVLTAVAKCQVDNICQWTMLGAYFAADGFAAQTNLATPIRADGPVGGDEFTPVVQDRSFASPPFAGFPLDGTGFLT
jgi:hypothetical protein